MKNDTHLHLPSLLQGLLFQCRPDDTHGKETLEMTSYMPKSKSDIHETPDRVFEIIEKTWGYKKEEFFDPCPLNPQFDGLEIEWRDLTFVNPPYTLLKEFVKKAIDESFRFTTIMLLPTKTDQQWFHDLKRWWNQIIWIQGRLKFKNNKWSATQPHFLVRII